MFVVYINVSSFIDNTIESIDISETAISDCEFLYSLEKLKEVRISEGQISNDDLYEIKNRGIDIIIEPDVHNVFVT